MGDDGDLTVLPVTDADAAWALDVLDRAEHAAGGDLVDEAERHRLERWVADGERAPVWTPVAARRGDRGVGYAAMMIRPGAGGPEATGDAAAAPDFDGHLEVLQALLAELAQRAASAGCARLEVWMRHADERVLSTAAAAGFAVERRLGVLGRSLDDRPSVPAPDDVEVRAYRPDLDDEAVVAVLAGAYAGTAEAGWDLGSFRERRAYGWFRPEDLLVAELHDGRLGGLHWLKRRGEDVGEVYNLAVHPDAQGRGLGPVLLAAGLAHLRSVGCHEVLLWVDLANERAVRLYRSQGFATRWEDVAVVRGW
jgi:mycothiol synthase